MGLFDRLKNIAGQGSSAPAERYATPTEAQADSAMNVKLAHVTSRWNRGSVGSDTAVNPMTRNTPTPASSDPDQNTPAWKAQQAQIDEKRNEVKGARDMNSLRGAKGG